MIVDPNQVEAAMAAATSVAPVPSFTPGPSVSFQKAGDAGNRTLWVVFVIMLVSMVIFSVVSFTVPIGKRLYHVVTTLIVTFAAISYFAMAVGDGITLHKTVLHTKSEVGPDVPEVIYREVYWARYVDWSVTTPLLLLDLALLAGLSGGNIFIAIVADIIMVLTGLFAAFGNEESAAKWGWYAIACIAYLVVVWQLAINGRATAFGKGGKVGNFFAAIAGFTFVIWTVYPIVWGIADGARIANVDQEIIAYAILDVLAKPIFGAWLLYTHATMPETNIEVGGFWTHGLTSEGAIRVGDDDEGA
ncbi:Opsin-1-like protein [Elsinoe australis]|uniref:Opsin-1 n=1 Tax=Elsinoe australis TaxID=40998 RepID=A0A2P7YE68_9PEZI|nr:Opsin-1 [Elsinoe australis]TKX18445.1 Opsin-1-like protein [Elsinoe australis]